MSENNEFKCTKCKKEFDWFGAMIFSWYSDKPFCTTCGTKLHHLFQDANDKIIKEFLREPTNSKDKK